MEKSVGLFYFIDKDVGGVVAEGSCADFDLLDVAETVVFGTHADGEDGVDEVVEFLASGQMVLGDGTGEVSLGRVGYDEEGKALLFLESREFHHEDAGVDAFVCVVAEVGEVVDYDNLAG